MAADDVPYLAALGHVDGIGPATLAALVAGFGSAELAWRAPRARLAAVLGAPLAGALAALRAARDVDALWAKVVACGARVVVRGEPVFPPALRHVPRPPALLYVIGDARLLARPAVAIVGTRRATDYGRRATHALAREVVAGGLGVVSGLALGIDSAAHAAALEAGGDTVAVLGCGIDVVYPAGNGALRDAIAAQGALVSEYPPGAEPRAGRFPARNRIIAGLTLATVVVEAGDRSGALLTAGMAADCGRDVFAVPGPIDRPQSRGPNRLLADGAGVALSGAAVVAQLADARAIDAFAARAELPDDPIEAALRAHLDHAPRHVDAIGRAAGLAAGDVARGLALLELKGLARHLGGMLWVTTDER